MAKSKSTQSDKLWSTPSWFKWMIWVVPVLTFLIYLQTVSYDFVLDDQVVYSENNFVQKGIAGIPDILSEEGFVGYFGERRNLVTGDRYRPLSLVTFAIEKEIAGNSPWLGHLVNAILYALLILVIYKTLILFKISWFEEKYSIFPFMAVVIYALHPVHVEAVANIKGRDEILAALFMVLALWNSQKLEAKNFWILLTLPISVFLAIMSKEHGITLLALIPLTQMLVYRHSRKAILKGIGLTAIGVTAYMLMRYQALGSWLPTAPTVTGDLMNNPFLEMEEGQRTATIAYTWLRYLGLLIFPHPLTHDYYPYHIPVMEWSDFSVIFSTLLYIALFSWGLFSWKKRPWLTWSVAAFTITLIPASNIFFTVGTFMNERFLFFPSLGYAVALGVGLALWWHSKSALKRPFSIVIFATLVLGYGLRTLMRIPDWNSGYSLNQSAIKVSDNSARINLFVGTDYYNQALETEQRAEKKKWLEKSRKHLEKAVRIYPLYGSAQNMLCGTCAEQFKLDNNIKRLLTCFEQVATFRPDTEYLGQFLNFLQERGDYLPELIDFYIRVGYNRLYSERANFPHALRYLRTANDLSGGNRDLYQKLSTVYLAFGAHLQQYPDPNYNTADIIDSGRYFGEKARGF